MRSVAELKAPTMVKEVVLVRWSMELCKHMRFYFVLVAMAARLAP